MDAGSFPSILLALAVLYFAVAARQFSRFFMFKAKLLQALQDLNCACEDDLITAVDFSAHRLVELAGEEMLRHGHVVPGEKVLALHTEIVRLRDAIDRHLEGESGPDAVDAVSSCAAAAEALRRWQRRGDTLKPDWGRVLNPFQPKRNQA